MPGSFGSPAPATVARYGPAVDEVLSRFELLCGPLEPAQVESYPFRQCLAAAQVLAVDAVGLAITVGKRSRVPLAASTPQATEAESLEFTLGQGPCLHATATGRPVLVPDLTDPRSRASTRWPQYAQEMLARTPYRAVFALPLTSGGFTLGALSLYRTQPGMLDFTEMGDALAVTHRIFFELVDSGTFHGELQPAFRWLNMPLAVTRGVVWQAIGMAVVEMELNPVDALDLLRSYSYSHHQLLDDVAAEVIARRLPLEDLDA